MPDIELRFHKDMLVLSAPLDAVLARQGIDIEQDREFLHIIEPEVVQDALRLEALAGAQCLITSTAGITAARLAHSGCEGQMQGLAQAALAAVNGLRPQHALVEIGPTGLPLDPTRASSVKQNEDQYADAVRAFCPLRLDAFFFNGMRDGTDLACALAGAKAASGAPVFASVPVEHDGRLAGRTQTIEDAFSVMAECGAAVVGLSTPAPLGAVQKLVRRARAVTELPLLVQLEVRKNDPKQGCATEDNPYYCADVMVEAATCLRGCGVQFLRACGAATPAYTGALAAASAGFDVTVPEGPGHACR